MAHTWKKNYGASKLVLVENGQLKNGTTFNLTLDAGWGNARDIKNFTSFMTSYGYASKTSTVTGDDTVGYGTCSIRAQIYQDTNNITLDGRINVSGYTAYSQMAGAIILYFNNSRMKQFSKIYCKYSINGSVIMSTKPATQSIYTPYWVLDVPDSKTAPWDSSGHIMWYDRTNYGFFNKSYEETYNRTNKNEIMFYQHGYANTDNASSVDSDNKLTISDLILYN